MKIEDWIAQQIEAAAPGKADLTAVRRLVDSAAALIGREPHQAFGLSIPEAGVPGSQALVQRCLAVLREWLPQLTSRQIGELEVLLESRGLPPLGTGLRPPGPVAQLHVFTAARLVNFETEQWVVDPGLAASLDGRTCLDDEVLGDLPCVQNVPKGGPGGLIRGGKARLVFEPSASELRCQLTFALMRTPRLEPDQAALNGGGCLCKCYRR